MTLKILHVIELLSLGGAGRSLMAMAALQEEQRAATHSILSLLAPDPAIAERARALGISLVRAQDLRPAIATADIVHIDFWNTPTLYRFLETTLPAARVAVTCHVVGTSAPQLLTEEVIDFGDMLLVTARKTFEVISPDRHGATVLARAGADFSRLKGNVPGQVQRGTVGYIGTLDFAKLHPDYVAMSAAVARPEARFVLHGQGPSARTIVRQAAARGLANRFLVNGPVEDIAAALSTFDVFGYPLAPVTYGTSELVLQEAMYAGVPCVVFPYGGAAEIVVDRQTGIVAACADEYAAAIASLLANPKERARLSENAKSHARQTLGVKNFSPVVSAAYERLMQSPKRLRPPLAPKRGAGAFLRGLGTQTGAFPASLAGDPAADAEIVTLPAELVGPASGGVLHYRASAPDDPYLRYWSGLCFLGQGRPALAAAEFQAAVALGFPDGRAASRLSDILIGQVGAHQ